MNRAQEYRDYLRSKEWSDIRERALQINGGICSFCNERATEVHHIRYPKTFARDSIFNVQPVCRRHHEVMHGMGNITPIDNYDVLEFHGQKFAIGKERDQFVGTSLARWCDLFGVPSDKRDIAREQFEDVAKSMARDNAASGVDLELIRRTGPKVAPLYAWEVARRAMAKMYDFLKFESNSKLNTDDERAALRVCWQGIHLMELQIDSWVKSLMRGEVVSARHSAHQPSGRLANAMQLIAEEQAEQRARIEQHDNHLTSHDEAIRQLQDPMLPLRKLIPPVTAREAVRAMGVDNESTVREGRGQTTEQAFGAILKKRWRGPGDPAKKSQRMAAESFSVSRTVYAYPTQHVVDCWPEFFELLSPNSMNF